MSDTVAITRIEQVAREWVILRDSVLGPGMMLIAIKHFDIIQLIVVPEKL